MTRDDSGHLAAGVSLPGQIAFKKQESAAHAAQEDRARFLCQK